jgi:hypothetical protein
MNAKRCLTFIISCFLLLGGCSKKMSAPSIEDVAGLAGSSVSEPSQNNQLLTYLIAPPNPPNADKRLIAIKHRLAVEVPESQLVNAYESVLKFLKSIKCEVLSSSINSQTPASSPRGELSLRVDPADLDKLFAFLKQSVVIIEHSTESEDKTAIVIDVEAQLKNMTELRDRLRSLLGKPSASVKDLVELESQLAEVQSKIDSIVTRRKVLANETEKAAVQISFRAKPSMTRTGVFAPIASAWENAGSVLSESFGSLITFICAIIPWLILIIPAIWLIIRFFRRRRARKAKNPA